MDRLRIKLKMTVKAYIVLLCLLEVMLGIIIFNSSYQDTNLMMAITRQYREPSPSHEQEVRDATRRSFGKRALFYGVILMIPMILIGPYIWYLFKVEKRQKRLVR